MILIHIKVWEPLHRLGDFKCLSNYLVAFKNVAKPFTYCEKHQGLFSSTSLANRAYYVSCVVLHTSDMGAQS